jgi:acyl-CoA synthetase (AMP-forming)/AMP-acid ligase II
MWLDGFRERVAAHPDRIAVVANERTYSYRELWERSAARGQELLRESTARRHVVLLKAPLAILEEAIAAWSIGRVPVMLDVAMPAASLEYVQELLAQAEHRGSSRRDATGEAFAAGVPETDPLAEGLVMTTAGTTGRPKLVALSHQSVQAVVNSHRAWFESAGLLQALVATPMSRGFPLRGDFQLGDWMDNAPDGARHRRQRIAGVHPAGGD